VVLRRGINLDIKLTRYLSDEILKELRAGTLRVLFMFDPLQRAILLLGGNKRDRWSEWYRAAIPEAERRYDVYLQELRDEGLL
jgi:hypothetical protein